MSDDQVDQAAEFLAARALRLVQVEIQLVNVLIRHGVAYQLGGTNPTEEGESIGARAVRQFDWQLARVASLADAVAEL